MATATARRSKKSRNSKPRARTLKNMINGEFVDPVDGIREGVINPATGDVIAKSPLSDKPDVDAAVKAAREAFDGWANTTRVSAQTACSRSPTGSRSAPRRSPISRRRTRRRAPRSSRTRSRSWSTTCATSRAPGAT